MTTAAPPSRVPAGKLAHPSYLRLAAAYPPHPIADDADYDAAVAALQPLALRGTDPNALDEGEVMYLDALSAFVEAYDDAHFAAPVSPLPDRLAALMEDRGVDRARVAQAAGCEQDTVADVLAGRREFTRDQVRRLADAFSLPAGFFLP